MEHMDKLAEQFIQEMREELLEKEKGFHKLPVNVTKNFFTNVAPNLPNLQSVKAALSKIYKNHGIDADQSTISSIITSYAKKVKLSQERDPAKKQDTKPEGKEIKESYQIDEEKMTQYQLRKREEIVKAMKKHYKEFQKKYGDRAKSVMYATSSAMAKRDTSMAPLDD